MRRDAIPMVGKKYGHILVLAEAGKRYYETSSPKRLVHVECDCGRRWTTGAAWLRRKTNRCRACANACCREQGRKLSVPVPVGEGLTSIAGIAEKSGLKIGTVYRRFLRGWRVAKLGLPLQTRQRGFGGRIDLPSRRGTVWGRRAGEG